MSKILKLIDAGIEAYHEEVLAMSDRELYLHCYRDGDFVETDFCVQELKRRGIEQFRDCHDCRGAGCSVCNGFGELPTFE